MRSLIQTLLTLIFVIYSINSVADNEPIWRPVSINNSVLLTLPHGKVVIELAPQFAPKHVAQFRQLTQQGFYNGTKFYRVIDGFVAQAGPKEGSKKDQSVPLLNMEAEWRFNAEDLYTSVQKNDLFAAQTGFRDSFAMAFQTTNNQTLNRAWLTHCPGVVAMARNNEADSASSHFYVVMGQAPRYLDNIMTIFGRVVYGMQHIQAITRTEVMVGEQAINARKFTPIVTMKLMADVPKAQQIQIAVENTESEAFSERLESRRHRDSAFFYKKPPPVLDVCQIPIRSRRLN